MSTLSRVLSGGSLLLLLTGAACAEDAPSGAPRVTTFSPRGGQCGTTVEVEFTGTSLTDPRGILFHGTDKIQMLKAAEIEDPKPDRPGRGEPPTKVRATLRIAPDCPRGQQAMRLQTAGGLSEVMLFFVGGLPSVEEAEDTTRNRRNDENASARTAQHIPLGCTVNGVLATLATGIEEDWYRIEAKKGQLITLEAEVSRLCSNNREDGFETRLTVRDAAGRVVASAESRPLLLIDPFLSLTAPETGPYFVSVSTALPPDNVRAVPYRLHAGSFRRPAAVYPAGGNPGEKLAARLIGLPHGTPDKVTVDLPSTPGKVYHYYADAGTPTPNLLRVLPGPNVLEQEPNDTPATATPLPSGTTVPFAVNGILEKPGDRDIFRFQAKKGERMLMRLYGQALGAPIDAWFSITEAGKEGKGGRVDDSSDELLGIFEGQTTRERLDPAQVWTAPRDGEYDLTISDTRGEGAPDFVYRVECTAIREGLLTTLAVDNAARLASSSVTAGRGNRSRVMIATRPFPGASGKGEYELVAHGLPAGVKMTAPRFQGGGKVSVLFEAAPDAPVVASAVELLAVPVDPEKARGSVSAFEQPVTMVTLGNDPSWQARLDRLAVAVADDVPFSITARPFSGPLPKNGETSVEITLTRHAGYKDDVEILLEQPPKGIAPQTGVVLTGGQTKVNFHLSAENAAVPGKYVVAFSARNRGGDNRRGAGKLWAASAPVPLEVSEPSFRVKLDRARVESGRTATVTGTVEQLRLFSGKATASLIRLPRGLSLARPVTLGTDGKLSFEITAAPDALVGSYTGVVCEIVVDNDGTPLRQIAGSGSVRVDPARTAP